MSTNTTCEITIPPPSPGGNSVAECDDLVSRPFLPQPYSIPTDPWVLGACILPKARRNQIEGLLSGVLIVITLLITTTEWCVIGSLIPLMNSHLCDSTDEHSVCTSSAAAIAAALVLVYTSTFFGRIFGEIYGNVFGLTISIVSLVLALCAMTLCMLLLSSNNLVSIGIPLVIFLISSGVFQVLVTACLNDHLNAHSHLDKTKHYNRFHIAVQCGTIVGRVGFPMLTGLMRMSWGKALLVPFMMAVIAGGLHLTHMLGYPRNLWNGLNPTKTAFSYAVVHVCGRCRNNCGALCCCCPSSCCGGPPPQATSSPPDDPLKSPNPSGLRPLSSAVLKRLLALWQVVLFLPVFWAVYMSMYSLWYVQASMMDRTLFGSISIYTQQINSVNPLLSVLMTYAYKKFQHFAEPRTWTGIGLVACILSCLSVTMVQSQIVAQSSTAANPTVSIWYQLPQYAFGVIAECLLYPGLLEYLYSEASPKVHTAMQSFLWLCIVTGNSILLLLILFLPNIVSPNVGDDRTLLYVFAAFTVAMLGGAVHHVSGRTQYVRRRLSSGFGGKRRGRRNGSDSDPGTPASRTSSGGNSSSGSRSVPSPKSSTPHQQDLMGGKDSTNSFTTTSTTTSARTIPITGSPQQVSRVMPKRQSPGSPAGGVQSPPIFALPLSRTPRRTPSPGDSTNLS